MCVTSHDLSILLVNGILQVCNLRLQRVECGLPLISHLEGSVGFRGFSGTRGTARKSGRTGVVCVDDVYCVSLVVLLDAYERKLSEDGRSSSELQVELVCNCSDEVVYCFVDFLGRGIGRGGVAKSV